MAEIVAKELNVNFDSIRSCAKLVAHLLWFSFRLQWSGKCPETPFSLVNRKRRLLQLVLNAIKQSGGRKDKSSLTKMKLMYLLIGSGAVELNAVRVSSSCPHSFTGSCFKNHFVQGGTSPLHAAAQTGNGGKSSSLCARNCAC